MRVATPVSCFCKAISSAWTVTHLCQAWGRKTREIELSTNTTQIYRPVHRRFQGYAMIFRLQLRHVNTAVTEAVGNTVLKCVLKPRLGTSNGCLTCFVIKQYALYAKFEVYTEWILRILSSAIWRCVQGLTALDVWEKRTAFILKDWGIIERRGTLQSPKKKALCSFETAASVRAATHRNIQEDFIQQPF